jgi:hypothetical protein
MYFARHSVVSLRRAKNKVLLCAYRLFNDLEESVKQKLICSIYQYVTLLQKTFTFVRHYLTVLEIKMFKFLFT